METFRRPTGPKLPPPLPGDTESDQKRKEPRERSDRLLQDDGSRVVRSIRNSTTDRVNPRRVHTSMVKKSAATSTSHCLRRNSLQLVFRLRSGAGSRPGALRMFAMVPRATSWPRLAGHLVSSDSPNPGSPWPCAPPDPGSSLGSEVVRGRGVCCHRVCWQSASGAKPEAYRV